MSKANDLLMMGLGYVGFAPHPGSGGTARISLTLIVEKKDP